MPQFLCLTGPSRLERPTAGPTPEETALVGAMTASRFPSRVALWSADGPWGA